jgi:hypothetical protein
MIGIAMGSIVGGHMLIVANQVNHHNYELSNTFFAKKQ